MPSYAKEKGKREKKCKENYAVSGIVRGTEGKEYVVRVRGNNIHI